MILVAFVVSTSLAVAAPTLILEKVRPVDDPRSVDLMDTIHGDRGVPLTCALAENTTVTLDRGTDATLTVRRGEVEKQIVVKNIRGLERATLACGEADDFYYVNPRHGDLHAYRADRLFHGDEPEVWTRHVEPFKTVEEADHVMSDTSVAMAVLVKRNLVMVEWLFRKNGNTGFWHQVFDAANGTDVGKLGPSDLLAKSNDRDPWWILFQGGGNDLMNYVPLNLYRLRFGTTNEGARPAVDVEAELRAQPDNLGLKIAVKRSLNPVVNHMIALLTPSRTTTSPTIEFCPKTPELRAKYWLGRDFNEEAAALARDSLLSYWAEAQTEGAKQTPIDAWFQTQIAPREPMKSVLARFDPQDDAWVARYQEALLGLGGDMLNDWFLKYGNQSGRVVRTSQAAP